jgi:hypothetical protein
MGVPLMIRLHAAAFAWLATLLTIGTMASSGTAQDKAARKKGDGKTEWAKVGPVPENIRTDWKLSEFYEKYADANGLPVLASDRVDDRALQVAADIVVNMLAGRDDVRDKLVKGRARIGIIPRDQETTDLPEYADLTDKAAWNKRARGLGGIVGRPLCSAGEENLLGLLPDRYRGESVLVHEFSHTMHTMGIALLDREFDVELESAFEAAQKKNLWNNTYAMRNKGEYWAEGVQSYFDCNMSRNPPDGIHNNVSTRDRLKSYDPRLFKIIDGAFKANKWRWKPPVSGVTIPSPPGKLKK